MAQFVLLHCICMPNIAPCCLTRAPAATKLQPCWLPPIHRKIRRFSPLTPVRRGCRLALALVIGSIGSVGMWSVVVVLPVVQAEFGATRGAVSLAFTLLMLGFGLGGVATGKITDRFGIVMAIGLSTAILGARLCRRGAFDHACGNSFWCIS